MTRARAACGRTRASGGRHDFHFPGPVAHDPHGIDLRKRAAEPRGISGLEDAGDPQLRDSRVTSALIGASSVAQLEDNLAAAQQLDFDAAELAEIDRYAIDAGINLWAPSSAVTE